MQRIVVLHDNLLYVARISGYVCAKCAAPKVKARLDGNGVPAASLPLKTTEDVLYIPYPGQSGAGLTIDEIVVTLPNGDRFTGRAAIVPQGGKIVACPERLQAVSAYADWHVLEKIPDFESNNLILADKVNFLQIPDTSVCDSCLDILLPADSEKRRVYTYGNTVCTIVYTEEVNNGIVNKLKKEEYVIPYGQWPAWAETLFNATEVYKKGPYYLIVGDNTYAIKETFSSR